MRKVVLSIFILFVSIVTVNAQIQKGTNMIGGSIYYSGQKSDITYSSGNAQGQENKNLGITPSYGKAIKQNLVVGADITYQNNVSKNTSNGNGNEAKTNSFGAGIFARHYKNLGQSGFYLFLQSRLGVNISKTKYDNLNYKSNGFDIGLGLNPGITYAITPKMHIETGLNNLFHAGYNHSKNSGDQTITSSKNSGFDAGIGLGSSTVWTVGVKFFFGS